MIFTIIRLPVNSQTIDVTWGNIPMCTEDNRIIYDILCYIPVSVHIKTQESQGNSFIPIIHNILLPIQRRRERK
jgi:hypothetical protein